MREKQRNQPPVTGKKSFWGWMLMISFFGYLALLSDISFMPEGIMSASISIISLPILVCVFSFYRWLYAFIASLRLSQAETLYEGNRLYQIAEMTSGSKTGASVNTIFCICFIFSAGSFVFGTFLLNPNICIFEQTEQQWMGFLQISICIIFMIIYFSVLSLLQIMDLKRAAGNMRLLFHMGKNQSNLKYLLCTQVLINLFMPTLMSFIILWTAAPFVNYKLNSILPVYHLAKPHTFRQIPIQFGETTDICQLLIKLLILSQIPLHYIWDMERIGVKMPMLDIRQDGTLVFQEMFSGALEYFYKGVSRYIYRCVGSYKLNHAVGVCSCATSCTAVPVTDFEYIEDVYETILSYGEKGTFIYEKYEDLPQ